jgi:hypothetical protein
LLLKKRGSTLKIVPNPPIVVGTGFKNFRPAFFARRNIVISVNLYCPNKNSHSPRRNGSRNTLNLHRHLSALSPNGRRWLSRRMRIHPQNPNLIVEKAPTYLVTVASSA